MSFKGIQVQVHIVKVPLQINVDDYTCTFGRLNNLPNACALEIVKQNSFVFSDTIEEIVETTV